MRIAACSPCSLRAKCRLRQTVVEGQGQEESEEEAIGAMKWSTAWKWILGLSGAVLAAQTNVVQAVFSILLFLALASVILFSVALFSMDFVEAMARGLESLERRVRDTADRRRTILSHSLHHLSLSADPRQVLFLFLPILAKPIGGGIQRLLRPHGNSRAEVVEGARKAQRQETIISRECR